MKPLLPTLLAALVLTGCGTTLRPLAAMPHVASAVAAKALDPAKFFGNAALEAKAPLAFSTQSAAAEAVAQIAAEEAPKRDALVDALAADKAVAAGVGAFPTLGWTKQQPLLERVMDIECQVLGFTPPALKFDNNPNRESFFDFDPAHPGVGTVILYPQGLAKDPNPYAPLLLLVHEVRHAAQFQLAYGTGRGRGRQDAPLARSFKASFETQKALYSSLTFCDFCSLMNEYEAFQCGNYVVGRLTGWKVDTSDMGCLSSQYDADGRPRLDLAALQASHPADLLATFNQLEEPQFEAMGGNKLRAIVPPAPTPRPVPLPCTADPLACN